MHKLSILLAEDMAHERLVIESELRNTLSGQMDLEFTMVDHAEAIERAIKIKHFDLAILDIDFSQSPNSKGMTGLIASRRIFDLTPDTYRVIVSSSEDESAMSDAVEVYSVDWYLRRSSISYEELAWLAKRALSSRLHRDGVLLERRYHFITKNSQTKNILKSVDSVLPSQNLIIYGETGTGKELIARRIHVNAKLFDQKRPLRVIDCSALSANLFEAELFGHKKGSFTGAATDRIGALQLANGGDLFLDEIQNIPLGLQQKLLRALNDGVFSPVGSNEEIRSKFRIIAATNIPVQESVSNGRLLPDFVSRIQKRKVELPSLRQRTDDIPALVEAYLSTVGIFDKEFSKDALQFICELELKTNIRGLYSVLDTAIAEVKVPIIRAEHLKRLTPNAGPSKDTTVDRLPSDEIEAVVKTILSNKRSITDVLDQIEGAYLARVRSKYRSAREFAEGEGYNRTTLLKKLRALGIDR